jgi:hypothetical protein
VAYQKGRGLFEVLVILFVSFVLVFGFVRPFVREAFWIPSESTIPTHLVADGCSSISSSPLFLERGSSFAPSQHAGAPDGRGRASSGRYVG